MKFEIERQDRRNLLGKIEIVDFDDEHVLIYYSDRKENFALGRYLKNDLKRLAKAM